MEKIFDPPNGVNSESHISSMKKYSSMHKESIEDPVAFWSKIAATFHWNVHPSTKKFLDFNFDVNKDNIKIEWMKDGKTNLCYNCLDRHLDSQGNKVKKELLCEVVSGIGSMTLPHRGRTLTAENFN